jgi:hypothetical protein
MEAEINKIKDKKAQLQERMDEISECVVVKSKTVAIMYEENF